ncbi:MAG: response regulator transcription factor [Candidatus Latescibacterota bacterium]|jgi:DNA-binding response OmpR family regulator
MTTILVVEDEEAIAAPLQENLEFEGYRVLAAVDGQQGLELALTGKPDLILLDVMLPGLNGYELCRRLRQQDVNTPVIFLTARGEEADKVRGLDLGGDDYLTKPVGILELLARIKAVLRRAQPQAAASEPEPLVFGRVRVDFARRETTVAGEPVHLSPKEYGILQLLAERDGRAVSRAELLHSVWGYDVYPTTRTIDTHVLELRAKLEEDPAHPRHLLTVHGTGYRLVR